MDSLVKWVKESRKTWTAVITAAVSWVIAYNIVEEKWAALISMVATAIGVYVVPNASKETDG